MPEPVVTAIITAVGGAATKELVSKTWDSGKKWLSTYFENHQQEAQAVAMANAENFLGELAQRVDAVEKCSEQNKDKIDAAFKEPSFSVLLQKAILNSAQTKDAGKHQLLARLITEKLQANEETTLSLASQMACDVIAFSTSNQLKILGLISAIVYVKPWAQITGPLTEQVFLEFCEDWVARTIRPLLDVDIQDIDTGHLEALSCIKRNTLEWHDLAKILSGWNTAGFTLSEEQFFNLPSNRQLRSIWNTKLRWLQGTSIGYLVGVYVADSLTGRNTSLTPYRH